MKQLTIWGYLHHDGGAGTEILGAVELLRMKGVPVRCVLLSGTDVLDQTEPRRRYFDSLGVETVQYQKGCLDGATIFCLGESGLFEILDQNGEQPAAVLYGSTMIGVGALNEAEIEAAQRGLVTSWVFQTEAQRLACEKEAGRALPYDPGYTPFFNLNSRWLVPVGKNVDKPSGRFNVGRIARDCPHKWHPDTWDHFRRFVSPVETFFTVIGWGEQGSEKIGNICQTWHRMHGQINVTWHEHLTSPADLRQFWVNQHCLFHYWDDFIENCPRVIMEAAAAGVPVITNARGGVAEMITHAEDGFLCKTPEEAIYCANRLAFNPGYRAKVGQAALNRLKRTYANPDFCWAWWNSHLED